MIKYSDLQDLCLSDLRRLKDQVNALIQDKLIESHEDIKVGSWVKINHRKCIGKKYIVEKINRKTYILGDGKGARIKASLGLIEAA